MYGAGNIGRGFIGQLFHMSGYKTSFIDINTAVIDRLNTDGEYPIFITDGDRYRTYSVTNVRGVNGADYRAVAEAIAHADVMATAVGVNILPRIAEPFACGVRRRMQLEICEPLNVIVCENRIEADKYLAELIRAYLSPEEKLYFDSHVAFVEPSIGRMVPAAPKSLLDEYPLAVCVEPYCELPVDRASFLGEIPPIANLKPFSPFDFYIRRKLFMHNMSHALVAYFGACKGYTYIWEAVMDQEIRALAKGALEEASKALSLEYGVPMEELTAFSDDLLLRYENRLLGDTVERVGRDTKRKLSENDRFVGAMTLCEKHGVSARYIAAGMAAGLFFAPEGDTASAEVQSCLKENGFSATLLQYCGIGEDSELFQTVQCSYTALLQDVSLSELTDCI